MSQKRGNRKSVPCQFRTFATFPLPVAPRDSYGSGSDRGVGRARMSDVFISYKRENLTGVGRLVEALRAEGVSVWWDQDIAPNAAWEATIEAALAAARLVIVAWSPAAVASENVKAEARWARDHGRLLQVFVEACAPPLFFGERQGVDLKHWSGTAADPAFLSVLGGVRKGLAQPASSVSDDAPPALISGAPPPLPNKPSIAVLPFANLSGDPEHEYFADGMVVEIVEALSRIRSIFVIASGASLSFKGKGIGLQAVARQLGVRYVLEGSVRKAANRVRIGVQLVDAADGAQIWTHRFEDTLEDVFALQDRVALAVAGQIEPTVQQAEMRRASGRPTDNMGSYDLYLRALPLFYAFARTEMLEALALLDRAIALDPDFGPALSLAGSCCYTMHAFGWSSDLERVRRRGVELTHRALKAAGDDANVLAAAAGPTINLEGDLAAATALVERAIDINSGSSRAWMYSSLVRLRLEETELAIAHVETSMRLEPMGPNRAMQALILGVARFRQGRFSETVTLMREVVQRSDHPTAFLFIATSCGHLGQAEAAREALAHYHALTSAPVDAYALRFAVSATYRKLFMDGIALAEGKTPSDAGAA